MSRSPKSKAFIRKPLDHSVHYAARFGATYFVTICCANKRRNQLCYPKFPPQFSKLQGCMMGVAFGI
jgi:hypothetical protein